MHLEGGRAAAAQRVDVDALVDGQDDQIGRPVEVRAVVDVGLAQHAQERLARVGVLHGLELLREPLGVGRVGDRAA